MLGIPLLTDYINKVVKPEDVADSVDYLNYYCTSLLLALAAFAISAKQYFGSPIQCWVPMEFRGGWEKYAEDYCFIQNSYYVPFEEQIPEELHGRRDQLSYYRWVPIVLALQAMAFFAPNFIWNILYKQTAVQPRGIVKEAQKCVRLCGVQRESEVHNLAEYICDTVSTFTPRGAFEKREFYRSGRNLAILYLITKLLYVVNILGQLYMMNHFLGGHYLYWGYETMLDVAIGKEWSESPIFPRVIMCDFQVRRLGNLQRHTVQCVIMMNMINEKLYLFLWFWFIFVGICTLLNFFYYLFVMGIPRLRAQLVLWNVNKQEMKLAGMSSKDLNRFVNDFLHVDGVLLLKFVNEHVSGRIARELVHDLIRIYARQNESYSPRKNNKAALHPLPRQLCTPTQPYESAPMLEDYIDGQNTLPIGAMARARANQRVPFNENAYAPPSGAPRQTTPTEV
uniref:Innexin n=1 Tax=Anisakis simplex TaxID=6269 RepID=A0A346RVL7_ANISI|nr:inexin-3 [Anisakis simplex]